MSSKPSMPDASRPLLIDGALHKVGGPLSRWKKRYFRLDMDGYLSWYESALQPLSSQFKGVVQLRPSNTKFRKGDNEEFADRQNVVIISIEGSEKPVILQCDNEGDLQKWMEHIGKFGTKMSKSSFKLSENRHLQSARAEALMRMGLLDPQPNGTKKGSTSAPGEDKKSSQIRLSRGSIVHDDDTDAVNYLKSQKSLLGGAEREGYLLKQSQILKQWRRRYFVLLNDGRLMYYKKSSQKVDEKLGIRNTKLCQLSLIGESSGGASPSSPDEIVYGFSLNFNGLVDALMADNESERNLWVFALTKFISSYTDDIKVLLNNPMNLYQTPLFANSSDSLGVNSNSVSSTTSISSTMSSSSNYASSSIGSSHTTFNQSNAHSASSASSLIPEEPPTGWLNKLTKHTKSWKKRYFRLLGDGKLEYYKNDSMNAGDRMGVIDVKDSIIRYSDSSQELGMNIKEKNYQHVFTIGIGTRLVILQGGSEPERRQWVSDLSKYGEGPRDIDTSKVTGKALKLTANLNTQTAAIPTGTVHKKEKEKDKDKDKDKDDSSKKDDSADNDSLKSTPISSTATSPRGSATPQKSKGKASKLAAMLGESKLPTKEEIQAEIAANEQAQLHARLAKEGIDPDSFEGEKGRSLILKGQANEGYLLKCSDVLGIWKERYCVLTIDGKLNFYSNHASRSKPPRSSLDIKTATIKFLDLFIEVDREFAFDIRTKERAISFAASSEPERMKWCKALGEHGNFDVESAANAITAADVQRIAQKYRTGGSRKHNGGGGKKKPAPKVGGGSGSSGSNAKAGGGVKKSPPPANNAPVLVKPDIEFDDSIANAGFSSGSVKKPKSDSSTDGDSISSADRPSALSTNHRRVVSRDDTDALIDSLMGIKPASPSSKQSVTRNASASVTSRTMESPDSATPKYSKQKTSIFSSLTGKDKANPTEEAAEKSGSCFLQTNDLFPIAWPRFLVLYSGSLQYYSSVNTPVAMGEINFQPGMKVQKEPKLKINAPGLGITEGKFNAQKDLEKKGKALYSLSIQMPLVGLAAIASTPPGGTMSSDDVITFVLSFDSLLDCDDWVSTLNKSAKRARSKTMAPGEQLTPSPTASLASLPPHLPYVNSHSGWLMKLGGLMKSKWTNRFFVVKQHVLTTWIDEPSACVGARLQGSVPHVVINLLGSTVQLNNSNTNKDEGEVCFTLISKGDSNSGTSRTYELKAPNKQVFGKWYSVLTNGSSMEKLFELYEKSPVVLGSRGSVSGRSYYGRESVVVSPRQSNAALAGPRTGSITGPAPSISSPIVAGAASGTIVPTVPLQVSTKPTDVAFVQLEGPPATPATPIPLDTGGTSSSNPSPAESPSQSPRSAAAGLAMVGIAAQAAGKVRSGIGGTMTPIDSQSLPAKISISQAPPDFSAQSGIAAISSSGSSSPRASVNRSASNAQYGQYYRHSEQSSVQIVDEVVLSAGLAEAPPSYPGEKKGEDEVKTPEPSSKSSAATAAPAAHRMDGNESEDSEDDEEGEAEPGEEEEEEGEEDMEEGESAPKGIPGVPLSPTLHSLNYEKFQSYLVWSDNGSERGQNAATSFMVTIFDKSTNAVIGRPAVTQQPLLIFKLHQLVMNTYSLGHHLEISVQTSIGQTISVKSQSIAFTGGGFGQIEAPEAEETPVATPSSPVHTRRVSHTLVPQFETVSGRPSSTSSAMSQWKSATAATGPSGSASAVAPSRDSSSAPQARPAWGSSSTPPAATPVRSDSVSGNRPSVNSSATSRPSGVGNIVAAFNQGSLQIRSPLDSTPLRPSLTSPSSQSASQPPPLPSQGSLSQQPLIPFMGLSSVTPSSPQGASSPLPGPAATRMSYTSPMVRPSSPPVNLPATMGGPSSPRLANSPIGVAMPGMAASPRGSWPHPPPPPPGPPPPQSFQQQQRHQ